MYLFVKLVPISVTFKIGGVVGLSSCLATCFWSIAISLSMSKELLFSFGSEFLEFGDRDRSQSCCLCSLGM